jgi:hypothetical protein
VTKRASGELPVTAGNRPVLQYDEEADPMHRHAGIGICR